jgi:hypothetical protein
MWREELLYDLYKGRILNSLDRTIGMKATGSQPHRLRIAIRRSYAPDESKGGDDTEKGEDDEDS